MVAVDYLKGPPPPPMTCSEFFKFITYAVDRYLPKIILYLLLVESYTRNSHTTTLVSISSGKMKFVLTFRLVVILTDCVFHCITSYFLL